MSHFIGCSFVKALFVACASQKLQMADNPQCEAPDWLFPREGALRFFHLP
jgi:hypothetical protein